MEHYIDLNMKSIYSDDGQYAPEQLVKMCADKGITIMALTDCNWVKGVEEAVEAAAQYGITCIPAIELECKYKDQPVSVLGYGINLEACEFDAMGEILEAQKMMLEEEPEMTEADIIYPNLKEMVELIHDAKGLAVLAAPGRFFGEEKEQIEELIEDVMIDGVECFAGCHSEEEADYYYEIARKNSLMTTAGSGFCGDQEPEKVLGEYPCRFGQDLIHAQLAFAKFVAPLETEE